MKMMGRYVFSRKKVLSVLLGTAFLFVLCAILGKGEEKTVWYALLLSGVLWLAAGVGGYASFAGRHKQLLLLKNSIGMAEELPQAATPTEEDYQGLIRTLQQENRMITSQADQKSRDMAEYYTLWAHQIKTPIAAMRLLLETTEQANGAELSHELFRVEQYVEMVLQYLRTDSDSNDFVLRTCNLDDIVRQAVRKYAMQFIRRKISLQYSELKEDVLTDEKWLVFLVEQVLSNALKYTREGSISISMEERTILVIADTGIGIREEDLPRVFENGFTGYNGRSDKKATGIGLYLCRRVCEKLGHTIAIESEVGKGTTVRLGLARGARAAE